MTFLTKNINYSQAVYLKKTMLQPLLKTYNDFLLKQKNSNSTFCLNKDINTGVSSEFIIPNNNIKYFLFATKKSNLETTKEKYNILYFFPDNLTINNLSQDKNRINTLSDFYMEINNCFDHDYLFEGYLYKNIDNKYQFLITDLLISDNNVIKLDYNMRFTILNEIIMNIDLHNLNNEVTINLHPVFNRENENMIKIFNNNFIYKDDICCIEVVDNFQKKRYLNQNDSKEMNKTIEIGKASDIYNVYDEETNNFEGILYIKGLQESKTIRDLFVNKTKIRLLCKYNKNFKKWQPLI